MPGESYTPQIQSEYQRLFDTCIIHPEKYDEVNAIIKTITTHNNRYQKVAAVVNVPWFFIGILHAMESGNDFKTHLYNGDSLKARTVNVPAGRPKTGNPPFEWEYSAIDSLEYDGLDVWYDWSIPGILYKMEGYNGFGYRSKGINSPYLWSYSNHYTRGKFLSDGKYSSTAVSKQCGGAVLLRRMVEMQLVAPGISNRVSLITELGKQINYAPNRYVQKVEELQGMLNLAGAYLKVDGKAGRKTSDAFRTFTGLYLKGDPEIK
ncbi:MAG: hypothetical protein JSS67_08055 [Bacteroidetes bacterium]|nr:hypothetical protein [Bacteroidota bacterium]